jgi:hypothetical protein
MSNHFQSSRHVCKNCRGHKDEHELVVWASGRKVWMCPDGSGSSYPATVDVKIELHYQAGEDRPWVAKWEHPIEGPGETVAEESAEAVQLAGRQIEKLFEEKTEEERFAEKAVEEAIEERF